MLDGIAKAVKDESGVHLSGISRRSFEKNLLNRNRSHLLSPALSIKCLKMFSTVTVTIKPLFSSAVHSPTPDRDWLPLLV